MIKGSLDFPKSNLGLYRERFFLVINRIFFGKKCNNSILAKIMINGHCLPLKGVKMRILDTFQKAGKH